jgi:hypothetical protein
MVVVLVMMMMMMFSVFIRGRHWCLCRTRWIHFTPSCLFLFGHFWYCPPIYTLGLAKISSVQVSRPTFCMHLLIPSVRDICLAQPIRHDLITLIILGEDCKLCSSSLNLCSFNIFSPTHASNNYICARAIWCATVPSTETLRCLTDSWIIIIIIIIIKCWKSLLYIFSKKCELSGLPC